MRNHSGPTMIGAIAALLLIGGATLPAGASPDVEMTVGVFTDAARPASEGWHGFVQTAYELPIHRRLAFAPLATYSAIQDGRPALDLIANLRFGPARGEGYRLRGEIGAGVAAVQFEEQPVCFSPQVGFTDPCASFTDWRWGAALRFGAHVTLPAVNGWSPVVNASAIGIGARAGSWTLLRIGAGFQR